jgi:hypothetical protein
MEPCSRAPHRWRHRRGQAARIQNRRNRHLWNFCGSWAHTRIIQAPAGGREPHSGLRIRDRRPGLPRRHRRSRGPDRARRRPHFIDDPLKPEEALSQTQRQAANDWFDHTLYSRLNDKLRGAIVLIMHRLHEGDLTGHVLAQEAWEVVRLPALAEEDEAQRVDTVLGPQRGPA